MAGLNLHHSCPDMIIAQFTWNLQTIRQAIGRLLSLISDLSMQTKAEV